MLQFHLRWSKTELVSLSCIYPEATMTFKKILISLATLKDDNEGNYDINYGKLK